MWKNKFKYKSKLHNNNKQQQPVKTPEAIKETEAVTGLVNLLQQQNKNNNTASKKKIVLIEKPDEEEEVEEENENEGSATDATTTPSVNTNTREKRKRKTSETRKINGYTYIIADDVFGDDEKVMVRSIFLNGFESFILQFRFEEYKFDEKHIFITGAQNRQAVLPFIPALSQPLFMSATYRKTPEQLELMGPALVEFHRGKQGELVYIRIEYGISPMLTQF